MEKLNYKNVGFYLEYYTFMKYMVSIGLYFEYKIPIGANDYLSIDDAQFLRKLRESKPKSCGRIVLSEVLDVFLGESDGFLITLGRLGEFADKSPIECFFEKGIINRTEYNAFCKRDLVAFKKFLVALDENFSKINVGCCACKGCNNVRRIFSDNNTGVDFNAWNDFCQNGMEFNHGMTVPNVCLKEFARSSGCKNVEEFLLMSCLN